MIIKEILGRRIKLLRQIRGLTQNELASLTDLKASTIYKIEAGMINSRIDTYTKIFEELGIDTARAFDFVTQITPSMDEVPGYLVQEYLKSTRSADRGEVIFAIGKHAEDNGLDPLSVCEAFVMTTQKLIYNNVYPV